MLGVGAGAAVGFAPGWTAAVAVALSGLVAVVVKRSGREPDTGSAVTWNPELVALPLVASLRFSTALSAVLLMGLLVTALLRHRSGPYPDRGFWSPVGMLAVATLLTFRADRLSDVLVIVGVAVVALVASTRTSMPDALRSLVRGLSLYCVANVLGWAAGLQSPNADERTGGLETTATVFSERVLFPFTRSLNEPPMVATALVVGIVVTVMLRSRVGWFDWLGLAGGVFIVVASNSRTALIVGLALAVAALVIPRRLGAVGVPTAAVALCLPFFINAFGPVLTAWAQSLQSVEFFARGQDAGRLASLGGRDVIWQESIAYWMDFVPLGKGLFGYGAQGHATSGAYRTYAPDLAVFVSDPTLLTTHNSLLQQVFDGGVAGALLFLGTVLWSIGALCARAETVPMGVVLAVLAVGGGTEVALAPGPGGTPFAVLLIVTVILTRRSSTNTTTERPSHAPEQLATGPTPEIRTLAGRHAG